MFLAFQHPDEGGKFSAAGFSGACMLFIFILNIVPGEMFIYIPDTMPGMKMPISNVKYLLIIGKALTYLNHCCFIFMVIFKGFLPS